MSSVHRGKANKWNYVRRINAVEVERAQRAASSLKRNHITDNITTQWMRRIENICVYSESTNGTQLISSQFACSKTAIYCLLWSMLSACYCVCLFTAKCTPLLCSVTFWLHFLRYAKCECAHPIIIFNSYALHVYSKREYNIHRCRELIESATMWCAQWSNLAHKW